MTAQKTLPRTFLLTAAPGVTADKAHGYLAGDRVIDTTHLIEYFCTDDSVGAAVWVANATAEGAVFEDAEFVIEDEADHTKQLQFSVGGQTTGTVAKIVTPAIVANRSYNLPLIAADDTIAVLGIAQTYTAAQHFYDNGFAVVDNGDPTKQLAFSVGAQTTGVVSTIVLPANVANRSYNLPLIAADDTFAVIGTSQTFSADQYFTGSVGIGTVSPQRTLHLSISNVGTYTAFAYENTDTTDANGLVNSYRTATTGAGAASFQELVAVQIAFTTHDHATRAASYAVYTSAGGAAAQRFKINSDATVDINVNTDVITSLGYGKFGLAPSGTSTTFYMGQTSAFTSTGFGFAQTVGGSSLVNAPTGQSVTLRINATSKVTLTSATLTVASGTPVTFSDTTDASSSTTGAFICSGGAGFAKAINVGTNITASGATSLITVGSNTATAPYFITNAAAGNTREIRSQTAGSLRWRFIFGNATAEGGSNAGSDINLAAYDDSGVVIDTVWTLLRVAAGTFTINRPVTISGSNAFKVAGLTSGRVTFSASGGQLTDSAILTFSGQVLSVGDGTSASAYSVSGNSGNEKSLNLTTGGSRRWRVISGSGAEAGANAGSAFSVTAYDDSGTLIDSPISITRAAAGTITMTRPVSMSSTLNVSALLTGQVSDAGTATTTTVLTIQHLTSGTPAAGYGTRFLMNGHSDTNTNRNLGYIETSWVTATDASRQSKMLLTTYNISTAVVLLTLSATNSTYGSVTVNSILAFNNAISAYDTSFTSPIIYNTNNLGGAYPFLEVGNLILSPRISGAARDVIISIAGTDADFKFDRSGILSVGKDTSASAAVQINGAAGNQRSLHFQSASVNRWSIMANSTAESGSDAGSPWVLRARTDAGVAIDDPISIVRAAAGAITFSRTCAAPNLTLSGTAGLSLTGSTSSYGATGLVRVSRCGGTIGTAGDMILQSDIVGARSFRFVAGTSPADVAVISGTGFLTLTTTDAVGAASLIINHTATITGGVTDGYASGQRFAPTYSGAFTVTRHNYMDVKDAVLAASAALTDACVFRFDAAAGTHKALLAATVKLTPSAVDAWMKHNVAGTLMYGPLYLSTTT